MAETGDDTKSSDALTNYRNAILLFEEAEQRVKEAEANRLYWQQHFKEMRYRATVDVACPTCESPIGQPCNWGNPDFHWYLTHTDRQILAGVNERPK